MLVCNVSMRPPRTAIAADIVETAAAADSPGTGNVVFATRVDDPASASEHVDAYLGQIMLEAANAQAVVNAGLSYAAAVVEAATATDVWSYTVAGVSAAVVEPATAVSTQDAVVVSLGRSAMLPGMMINPSTSRQANAAGTMVNL
jgi:hypothetical protein